MATENASLLREVLACLMCSAIYFELRPRERLNLVKSLAAELASATPTGGRDC